MKKSVVVLFLLCAALLSPVWAQSGKVRPRVAEPSAPPTIEKSDAPAARENQIKQPPVFRRTEDAAAKSNQPNQPNAEFEDDGEIVRVNTSLVQIPATVIDRQGRFVTNLTQADFKVFENGKEQEIVSFAQTEQPITIVLLIDVSRSTAFKIEEIQDAAQTFVRQLKQADRVMVVSFNEDIKVLSEPTTDRNQIFKAIKKTKIGSGTALYDAVDYVVNRRLRSIEGRKAVVLFTDGVDTESRNADYSSNLSDLEESDTTIFPIYYSTYRREDDVDLNGDNDGGWFPQQRRSRFPFPDPFPQPRRRRSTTGTGTTRPEHDTGEQYVEDVAQKTGGKLYRADSTRNLETAFFNIGEELRRQYIIGYTPAENGQKGERRSIKVRVATPNVAVRARDSYVVN